MVSMNARLRLAISSLALLLPAGCHRPTHDAATLAALRSEAGALMTAWPAGAGRTREVPPSRWPPAIAGLGPQRVTTDPTAVDIATTASFDDGWGYRITRDPRDLPMPASCDEGPARAVFRHGPC